MGSKATLYDLGSTLQPERCWSINPWKARLILNYKGIPYNTEFLKFPQITPTLTSLGVPAADDGRHTIPAVRMPDGTVIMDNAKITPALEELKPTPSLHLGDPMFDKVKAVTEGGLVMSLMPEALPKIDAIQDAPSQQYFAEMRLKRFNIASLEDFRKEKGYDKAWANAAEPIKQIAALLKENSDGPYFLGKEPSYSDIWLLAMLMMMKVLDEKELFDKIVAHDPVFTTWFEACKPWAANDK